MHSHRSSSVGLPLSRGRTWLFSLVVVLPIDPLPTQDLYYSPNPGPVLLSQPRTCITLPIQDLYLQRHINVRKQRRSNQEQKIKNRQLGETGNIGYTRDKTKTKEKKIQQRKLKRWATLIPPITGGNTGFLLLIRHPPCYSYIQSGWLCLCSVR